MTLLYPRLANTAAQALFNDIRDKGAEVLIGTAATGHVGAFYAATGGIRADSDRLRTLQGLVRELARDFGYPEHHVGRRINRFDNTLAELLHAKMEVVPAEAADRRIWAFLALVLLPDVAVWRFPDPPGDRLLATDITRHVFGRLWWRAELLIDADSPTEPYALLDVFPERNFDQILARRRSIGGSPELIRALAREWPRTWSGINETDVLRDTLKHLMRRGAFQDLYSLPAQVLQREVAEVIRQAIAGRLAQAAGRVELSHGDGSVIV
jgi:hypothetical protein